MLTLFISLVEKSSKYYLVKNILLALFEVIDSDKVPQNARRRVPYLSGAGGFYLNDSITNSHGAETSAASSTSSVVPSPTTTKDANSNNTAALQNITRQLTNQSAVSRMSATLDAGDIISDGSNELVDLIARCLRTCGEEEGFIPLFKVVFTTLSDVEDNRYTRRLDGRARDILLKGLITRMVRYVSEHIALVFISDDIQCKWLSIFVNKVQYT